MFKARLINFVLLPFYWHFIIVLVFSLLISLGLKAIYVDDLLQQSTKLDLRREQITQQLNTYNKNRSQIIQALSIEARLEHDLNELDALLSMASLNEIESWLINLTQANQMQPRQILVKQNLSDELGEYARITIDLSGSIRQLQAFLRQSLDKEYFLIWEELIIKQDTENLSRMAVKMSLKRYFKTKQDA